MSKAEESAFPTASKIPGTHASATVGGLTKREYYAGLTLQGLLGGNYSFSNNEADVLAAAAVNLGDALLMELSKER